MSSDKQLNYVNNLQNRDQNLYYVDDASELNSINLKENDKIYAINDNKLFQMEIVDQEEELSGSIVSFNGRNNTKIKSLVTNIEPQQDLHGYDNPWPAGGGPNLLSNENISRFNQTSYGITYTVQKDGSIKAIGTVTTTTWNFADFYTTLDTYGFNIGDTIALSCFGDNVNFAIHFYNENTFISGIDARATNPTAIIPEGTNRLRMLVYCKANAAPTVGEVINKIFYPQLEKASTPSTQWYSYSNICSINGQMGIQLNTTRINVWDEKWEIGGINPITGVEESSRYRLRSKNYISVKPGRSYYFCNLTTYKSWIILYGYDVNKIPVQSVDLNGWNKIITIPDDIYYLRFCTSDNWGGNDYIGGFSINYPTTDIVYHSYTGNQISVTFPTEAGMIYGATMTLNPDRTGMLVVDKKITRCTVDSMRSTYQNIAYAQVNKPIDSEDYKSYREVDIITSNYPVNPAHPSSWDVAVNQGKMFTTPNKDAYWFGFPVGTTLQEAQTALNDCTICYPLAIPVIYQLTESEISGILSAFLGTNNIWADIGDITVKIAEKGITAFELAPHT